jgi:hypothetical protein
MAGGNPLMRVRFVQQFAALYKKNREPRRDRGPLCSTPPGPNMPAIVPRTRRWPLPAPPRRPGAPRLTPPPLPALAVLVAWRNRRATAIRLTAPFLFLLLALLIQKALEADSRRQERFRDNPTAVVMPINQVPSCNQDLYIGKDKELCYHFFYTPAGDPDVEVGRRSAAGCFARGGAERACAPARAAARPPPAADRRRRRRLRARRPWCKASWTTTCRR